jgi:hypothetical protein
MHGLAEVLIVTACYRLSGRLPTEDSPYAQLQDVFGTTGMDDPLSFSADP